MSKNQKKLLDIGSKTKEDLHNELLLCKKELLNLRFQKVLGELKNTSVFSEVRRKIARINTELSKRAVSSME